MRKYKIMSEKIKTSVECITGDEGENLYFSDDLVNDLLDNVFFHPIRENIIKILLKERNCSWNVVNNLIKEGIIEKFTYAGRTYFVRKTY